VQAVVGISQHILETHVRAGYFAGSRHAVIHNAVAGGGSAPVPVVSGDGERLVVGYLGRLEEEKGVELLIRAWQAGPRTAHRLLIAGSGAPDYEHHLLALAADSAIEFVGTVDAGSFLRHVDLLVVPSLWAEPMGRVVVEAYLAGRPVVVSNRGGLPELVDEGRTGWIVEPTVEALSSRLQLALAAPALLRAMAAEVSRKSVEFDALRMVDRYEAIYRSVVPD
jgi:glycosyltransferase involved in cell wall biosynthesis